MILSQLVVLFCTLEGSPSCIQLTIAFPGPATEAACAAVLRASEPQFTREHPGYALVPDYPVDCRAVDSGGTPVRAWHT